MLGLLLSALRDLRMLPRRDLLPENLTPRQQLVALRKLPGLHVEVE